MSEQKVEHLFNNIFGWDGYSITEQEFLIKKFLNVEGLTIDEVEKEIQNSY